MPFVITTFFRTPSSESSPLYLEYEIFLFMSGRKKNCRNSGLPIQTTRVRLKVEWKTCREAVKCKGTRWVRASSQIKFIRFSVFFALPGFKPPLRNPTSRIIFTYLLYFFPRSLFKPFLWKKTSAKKNNLILHLLLKQDLFSYLSAYFVFNRTSESGRWIYIGVDVLSMLMLRCWFSIAL